MTRESDLMSRGDIADAVGKHEDDLHERRDCLEESERDIEIIRDALKALNLRAPADDNERIEQAVDRSESAGIAEFDSDADAAEDTQHETQEREEELREGADATTSDLEQLRGAEEQVRRDAPNKELAEADQTANDAIEFLDEQSHRALEAREESERALEELRALVNAGRSA